MTLEQSVDYKKNYQSNVELIAAMEYLIEQLKNRGFQVQTNNNRIDFDLKPSFTTNWGENKNAALRLLRHGFIVLNENQDSIRIRCKYSIRYLLLMSVGFGLAVFGLNIIYSIWDIWSTVLMSVITFGLIFGIGLFALWINVKNLIKK